MVLCTLFDKNYLDKAIVMIDSLNNVTNNLKIYVLPMEDRCLEILLKEDIKNVEILDYNDFINKENLFEIKSNRSLVEFYYTCTPHLIEYVIKEKKEKMCTYIDSDLFFYSNPEVIVDEIGDKDVQIIKHGFSNSYVDREKEKRSGKYCVEFNTFKNTEESLKLLLWWKNKCRQYCGYQNNNFGDQKYLDEWSNNNNVSVVENPGAGIAPWNINQFKFVSFINKELLIAKRNNSISFPLVFYHFENIQYLDFNRANINVYKLFFRQDKKLVNLLYSDYLNKINEEKQRLYEKYSHKSIIKKHPSLVVSKNKKSLKTMSFIEILLRIRSKVLFLLRNSKDLFYIK